MKTAIFHRFLAAAISLGTATSVAALMTTADIKPTDQGVLFVNYLGVPIVDAFAQPREQCEVYLCDQWRSLDPKGWVLENGKASAMGMIFSSPEGQPKICQWALKIVTEDAHSYAFGPMNICVPELRNRIDFIRSEDGQIKAVQHWKDEKGLPQSSAFVAQ